MTQSINVGFHDPRNSDEINDRFVGTRMPLATSGFNVREQSSPSTAVDIRNADEPTKENVLITPEGVVIHESDVVVTNVEVGASPFTGYVVCRYKHGTEGAVATYLAVTVGAYLADRDTILALIVKVGAGVVLNSHIFEPPRQRFGGGTTPISWVYGIEAVQSAQAMAMGGWDNLAGAAWASGYGADMPYANDTQVDGDLFVPAYHATAIKSFAAPATTTDLWITAYFKVSTISASGRSIVVDANFWEIVDGATLSSTPDQTYQETRDDLQLASLNDVFAMDFSIVAPTVDTLYHLNFMRRGTLVGDDWQGNIRFVGAVLRYARNRVGKLYV